MSEETTDPQETKVEKSEPINLSEMEPEAIMELVRVGDEEFEEIDPDFAYTEDVIQDMFNYLNAVVFLKQWEKGARVLRDMKPVIDEYFNDAVKEGEESEVEATGKSEDIELALDYLVDWHMLSLRFTPETRKDFSDIEHYRELLHAFEVAPPKFRVNEIRAKLQMIHHYNHWISRGGDVELLSDEDYDLLQGLSEEYMDELEELLEEQEKVGEWDNLIRVKRTLHRYFVYRGQANNAIKTIKELIELMPKKEDYTAADTADLQMDLAKIYMNYKKWKTAWKYFSLAKKNYEKDDLEMFVMQAESWAEECEKILQQN